MPNEDDFGSSRLALPAILVFALTAMSALGYYAWWHTEHMTVQRLNRLASFAARSSQLFLERAQSDMAALATTLANPAERAHTTPQSTLAKFLGANRWMSAIALTDGDGRVVLLAARDSATARALSNGRALLAKTLSGCRANRGLCLAHPWSKSRTHGPVLPLIQEVSGEAHGKRYLIGLLPLDREARTIWGSPALPRHGSMGLLEGNRYLIVREPPAESQNLEPHGALVKTLARHRSSIRGVYQGYVPADRTHRIGVYRRLPSYPLTLFISVPTANILWYWGLYVGPPILLAWTLVAVFLLIYYSGVQQQSRWRTATERAEQHLSETRERALTTLQAIGDAVITTDASGHIDYLNPKAVRLTGWTKEAAIGLPLRAVYRPVDTYGEAATPDLLETCLRGGRVQSDEQEAVLKSRSGAEFAIEHSAAPIRNHEGVITGIVAVCRDVTEKKALAERLAHQAMHDPLTGLPKRRLLEDQLKRDMAPGQLAFALLFLAVDGLKSIADHSGHYVMERVLVAVAQRLKGLLREHDFIARHGEEAFAVILRDASGSTSEHIANQVITALSGAVSVGTGEVFVDPSLGIALYPVDATDPDLLARAADMALEQARKAGGRTVRLFDATAADSHLRVPRALDTGLRRALERGELYLAYQPQIDLASGRIVAAEALLRWQHPDLGLVPPVQFIPIAEDNGLIVPIGEWVLREACRQNREWRDRHLPSITVGVNVSGRQCREERALNLVSDVLAEMNLPVDALQLELTESLLIHGDHHVLRVLNAWAETGVSLAIDDFGTGYSSLSYLKHLPVDTLKIDQSFLVGVPGNASDNAILQAILAIGHTLKLQTVAEGVETEAQWEFLRSSSCAVAQGFAIGRPMAPAQLEALLRSDPRLRRPRRPPHLAT
ncbi:MAG: bifunctional diguanylate cyclase/phosphodiesterase [Acidiferrobacteraceae bacterium]